MKKILIIGKTQFGYHIDTYYYCKYLSETFHVTYICFNDNLNRIESGKTKVIYVSTEGEIYKRAFRFYKSIWKELRNKYNAYLMVYFKGCSITGLFFRSNVILDFRSASVASSQKKRKILDLLLKTESRLFKHLSVISQGLANYLEFKKVEILPLGAIEISKEFKEFKEFKLLYVGTFSNRRIFETIEGIAKYYKKTNNKFIYTIVGFGSEEEESQVKNAIIENDIKKMVRFVGRVSVDKLNSYFDNHNVGIAYVPQTQYYDHQPVTKIFEYGLSGMPIIATDTSENRKVISSKNGIICKDNPDSFCDAIIEINKKLSSYSSLEIRNSFKEFHWENIINNILKPFLVRIIK